MVDEKTNEQVAGEGVQIDADELRARAGTFAFLARALSDEELPVEFLGALAAGGLETGTALDGYMAGLADLSAEQLEERRRDLAADHSTCLLGMSARPVSPFESVYTTDEHLMRRDSCVKARQAYAASGFAPADVLRVPEDHIAVELQFCAMLLNRAADFVAANEPEAAGRDMAAQATFVREHLVGWTPHFCDLLEGRASTDFYRGIAQMLRRLVSEESTELGE